MRTGVRLTAAKVADFELVIAEAYALPGVAPTAQIRVKMDAALRGLIELVPEVNALFFPAKDLHSSFC